MKIIYTPEIEVIHAHAMEGRANWRRYYFDTRNLIWLAYRNYNKRMLAFKFPLQIAAMLFYSLRDGYLKYFFKAIYDGTKHIKTMQGQRNPVTSSTYKRIQAMDEKRPSLLFYIKERVFRKEIKL